MDEHTDKSTTDNHIKFMENITDNNTELNTQNNTENNEERNAQNSTENTAQKKRQRPIIGIRLKMGATIGLIVILISVLSFSLAVYLHVAFSFNEAIETDLYSGQQIIGELDPVLVTQLLEQGKAIYDSIPEELRANKQSPEYLSQYDVMLTPEYESLKQQLEYYAKFEDLKWLDLRIADPANKRWIYLIDTDAKGDGRYAIGYWENSNEAVSTFRPPTPEEIEAERNLWMPIRIMLDLRYINVVRMERFSTVTELRRPETGEVIGYLGTGEQFSDYQDELAAYRILFLMALGALLVVVFAISGIAVDHLLVQPIMYLASAAADYVADRDKTTNTRHFDRVMIRTHDELQLLKDSMVNMEEDLTRYVQDLSRMTAERERAAVEMELSARIQSSLLPKRLENFTGERSFSVHALIDPAKDVGGDFYDFYAIDDDHIAITVADVSDKGVPAAMFMLVTKTLLKMAGGMSGSPAKALSKVNRQLCGHNNEMMFVTVFFGIYTISEKKLTYVNAGHEEMAIYRKEEGAFALEKEDHDFVVAVLPDAGFTERELLLSPGDKLFLYTDGVPEANNEAEEMFGEERMIEGLNSCITLSGDELLHTMRAKIHDFAGAAPQFDDVTMLLLEVR